MTLLGILIGSPIGVLAGTYLAEYGRNSRLCDRRPLHQRRAALERPSIIIGLFIYEIMVVRMGHFSAIAGALALAVIAIPVTVRTTEDMLNLVPAGMKDASAALGAYPWRTIMSVIYPAARSGIVTGLLLAVARISGETAPLLFTALNNQFWSTNLQRADGESAGGDLPVRAEPVHELAGAGLGRRAAHHGEHLDPEHHRARWLVARRNPAMTRWSNAPKRCSSRPAAARRRSPTRAAEDRDAPPQFLLRRSRRRSRTSI